MPDPLRRRVAAFFGEGITYPSIIMSLRCLERIGFRPDFTVDIGAYHGEWTKMCKAVFPATKILMVEAQQGKIPLLESVVTSFVGEVTLVNTLPESSPVARHSVEKVLTTVDRILTPRSCPPVDFLKLDVQGYELEVLKGASLALAQAQFVLLEVSLLLVNKGCPPFEDVIAFMDQAGFRVFDFAGQGRRRDGVLWQIDLVFIRKGSRFAPSPEVNQQNWGAGGYL